MTTDPQGRRRRRLTATVTDLEVQRQRAFLIGVASPRQDQIEAEASLDELALLTDTAGSDPVDSELVRRPAPDPATFIGSGKAEELAALTTALDIDVVVFDNDLSPAQQRNLQKIFHCDVVDREAVILDIFAQHATSREGMVQVELALLHYHLPRLRGKGTELSRQAAGIGTRGPGETKLETDRRRILSRIAKLKRELVQLEQTRHTQRKARRRTDIPQLALVGYTNAGKSTLLNRLTAAGVLTEDRLFSTLDSTARRLEIPDGPAVVVTDTVGFVRRLPHDLVEAFASTLEEVADADLLIHVVDGSDLSAEAQIDAVRRVLEEIGAGAVPELIALNKQDVADPVAFGRLRSLHPEAIPISAAAGSGIDNLLAAVVKMLAGRAEEVDLTIPYTRGDVLAALHRQAEVLDEEHLGAGTRVRARVPRPLLGSYREFLAG